MTEAIPPEPVTEQASRSFRIRWSLAWLIPLIALVIALGIAARTYSDRGPLIEIMFDSGEGISAGQTLVKFKDFNIGVVEGLELTDDLRQVVAEVRLQSDSAKWIDADTKFWLVSARVGPQGISGLGTVLGGAYIEAEFDADIGSERKVFTALEDPPLTPLGQPGLRIHMRAPEGGSVTVGAPVLFKKIAVGKVEDVDLTEQGDVLIKAFINAPFDNRVTTATRFWNSSGFNIEVGLSGASVNVESFASLLQGGIAFDTVTSGGEPVVDNHEFQLFSTEREARVVVANEDQSNRVEVMTHFRTSVQGIEVGDAVRHRGIPVGEITQIMATVVREDDEPFVVVRVAYTLFPSRFGIYDQDDPQQALLDLIEESIENGMRAQLQGGGLLSGGPTISLEEIPDAEPAEFDSRGEPYPEIPGTEKRGSALEDEAQGVLARLQGLPLEDVLDGVTTLLANANRLITDESVKSAPANLGLLLADLREIVSDSGLKEVPAEITAILASVRMIVDEAAEEEIVSNLNGAVDDARAAIRGAGDAIENLPQLLDRIEELAADVLSLPLDEAVTSVTGLIDSIDDYVKSDEMAALPGTAGEAIDELRLILEELRDGGATGNITATLANIRKVTDEIAAAELAESITSVATEAEKVAQNVGAASEDLKELLNSITRLADDTAALPLDDLVASASSVLDSAEVFISSEGVEAVPPRLNAALEELTLILRELREGGTAENVNATLASADEAAAAIAKAAEGLPELVNRLNRTAAQADQVLASVGPNSQINRETVALLTEVRDAARAVNSLVSAIERRPNSILFGR